MPRLTFYSRGSIEKTNFIGLDGRYYDLLSTG